ncbi:ervatamin-B-like [Hordeum vulgare subsp. vulgare]|uniref:ervatamin-B-like n=1 Tax=Hordeum vulgare subsp. vulgare TaxID=112509 RepID=UPI001D1A3BED|nr:ervatamin-B-like [Hordeum vulgare subsp. vulgare]
MFMFISIHFLNSLWQVSVYFYSFFELLVAGCCWAMVVVAAIEALYYIKRKEALLLSVQELIDCDTKSFGCAGGYTENALKYVQKNGISKESDYGYMGRERILGCKKSKTPAAAITGFRTIDNPNEESLEEAVSQQPVIIRLQCSGSFREYKGGIIDSPPAAPKSEGMFVHYVLIVGYDTDSAGVKFWRIKNTAGEGWGEGGFGKLPRHVADQRGVLGMFMYPAMYPVLDS